MAEQKIIDFERKGNVVRFYLGAADCNDYWGDDWDDSPYDCNAGSVYGDYVAGVKDVAFPFDSLVLEPSSEWAGGNNNFSKEDMKKRIVPCIIVVPPNIANGSQLDQFSYWANGRGTLKFYFGDKMNHSIGLSLYDFTASSTNQNTVYQGVRGPQGNGSGPVPIWEKENLTLSEAAAYFGIGQNRLYALTKIRNCNFVLFVGNRRMIKRKVFEKYLEGKYAL